jgi:hypothetical protein
MYRIPLLGILIKLDDNSPSKNDRKDPKTIAMLVKDGYYREVCIPEDVYQELREAISGICPGTVPGHIASEQLRILPLVLPGYQ